MPSARAPDGTQIAYRVTGHGSRTVILIHAWGVSGRYFDDAIEFFDPNAVRLITLDLRGHGDSEKPEGELTWDLLARDVLAVADDARARTFTLVGHSLGGKLAQYMTLVDPARVEALVLVTSPSAGPLETPDFVKAWVELAGDGDALVKDSIERFLKRPVPQRSLDRIAAEAAKIPRSYLEGTLRLVGTTSFIDRLGSAEIPVLLLSTADDEIHVTERDIHGSFPRAQRITIESGSEIPLEQPKRFAEAVQTFLAAIH